MQQFDLYQDIAMRTNGDIYVGVVGPVRAGKSTFIAKFMQSLVLPNITNKHVKERATDEMPQSADGKAIMTTQPKFVPSEAAVVKLKDNIECKIRLVDCVGYVVDGATGHKEGSKPRLVRTPWSDTEIPFEQAAEIGTKKVITDHSTIGFVVTTDATIGTELSRAAYAKAEERVVEEMNATGKPYIIVLNSSNPESEACQKLKFGLSDKYKVPVVAVDVLKLTAEDINSLFENILMEFPLQSLEVKMPKWLQTMDADNVIMSALIKQAMELSMSSHKMRDYAAIEEACAETESFEKAKIATISLGEGKIVYEMSPKPQLFWSVLSEECACPIEDDYQLMAYMKKLVVAKVAFDKIKTALEDVEETGYGIVSPTLDQMTLEEPEIVKQGSRFGVRLKASAPSLHIMKVDLHTEVSPIVGTEQQSEELVKYLLSEFESDPKGIWDTQMFGKSLHKLVKEGLNNKLYAMPVDSQEKMRRTVGRIVNEGKGGVVCILL